MIFKLLRTTSMLLILFKICTSIFSQNIKKNKGDFSGTWTYEVRDTPSGNYAGKIILTKSQNIYKGQAINQAGIKFTFDFVEKKGNILTFRTNLEETNSLVYCKFSGNFLTADVKVRSDSFAYKLKGKKITDK